MWTEKDKELIRLLQDDLPLTSRPYQAIGEQIGLTEEEVLAAVQRLKDTGAMRRLGVALRHREVGYTANGMGCWNVPEEKADEIGKIMAGFREVSHCYQRPRFEGWPYSHFTMIHGTTREDCEAVAKRISEATGITDYRLLFSTVELKKTSMRYFMEKEA
ncbi:AsnC family transcriptional regulator [Heliophilum fasciatum]|uniref:siroheme decarboxylase n=1 Tax=Heliophilum fasciatum TaxID=35700 RepID=A7UGV6_9FIRM|nr:AsnC family transcriptional regulator [Heliophilum fasciatum]ABU41514.1 NirL [Heliophilum fasciatum]MCW2278474.1 DNA-binding Lrp family transcriptional regulator [Heliophilum fasciatum]TCP63605.1 AsnC family transcriptional regulator [Heliophilum fasciatum]